MNLSHQQLQDYLQDAGLSCIITEHQSDLIFQFLQLRDQWSQTHNLSGPQALQTVWTDVIDVCALTEVINNDLPILDIGSGSGVPGLMLACIKPKHNIYLIEPAAKRCAFLKTAAYRLQLKNIHVWRGRWPWSQPLEEQYQIMSRAVIDPKKWPLWAQHDHVQEIIQMLAAERPQWPIVESTLQAEVNYQSPLGGHRQIRRWSVS